MLDCLIVGGDSPIGAALAAALAARGATCAATSRRPDRGTDSPFLDLETLEGADALPPARMLALVAAETRFAVCAAEPERTRRINVDAPVALATRALAAGSRVLFFSSIAVHDGTVDRPAENDEPRPASVYGTQKRGAEKALAQRGGDVAILRPSKVIHPGFPLFQDWLDALHAGHSVEPFSDMIVAPVWLDLVARAAAGLLLDTDESGVFQLSATENVTYADIARHMARRVGASESLVRPVAAATRLDPKTLSLPVSARLSCERLRGALGIASPPALEAVDLFIRAASNAALS